jgi:hypothetical protein
MTCGFEGVIWTTAVGFSASAAPFPGMTSGAAEEEGAMEEEEEVVEGFADEVEVLVAWVLEGFVDVDVDVGVDDVVGLALDVVSILTSVLGSSLCVEVVCGSSLCVEVVCGGGGGGTNLLVVGAGGGAGFWVVLGSGSPPPLLLLLPPPPPPEPKLQSTVMTPTLGSAKNVKRPWVKSRPPEGQPGH